MRALAARFLVVQLVHDGIRARVAYSLVRGARLILLLRRLRLRLRLAPEDLRVEGSDDILRLLSINFERDALPLGIGT